MDQTLEIIKNKAVEDSMYKSQKYFSLPFPSFHFLSFPILFLFCLAFFSFPYFALPFPCFVLLLWCAGWGQSASRNISAMDSRWKKCISKFSSLYNLVKLAFRVGQLSKIYSWITLRLFPLCIIVNANGLLFCFSVARWKMGTAWEGNEEHRKSSDKHEVYQCG